MQTWRCMLCPPACDASVLCSRPTRSAEAGAGGRGTVSALLARHVCEACYHAQHTRLLTMTCLCATGCLALRTSTSGRALPCSRARVPHPPPAAGSGRPRLALLPQAHDAHAACELGHPRRILDMAWCGHGGRMRAPLRARRAVQRAGVQGTRFRAERGRKGRHARDRCADRLLEAHRLSPAGARGAALRSIPPGALGAWRRVLRGVDKTLAPAWLSADARGQGRMRGTSRMLWDAAAPGTAMITAARAQYVNWCAGGGSKDAFFTSDACHQLYMNHVKHFVNRRAPPSPHTPAGSRPVQLWRPRQRRRGAALTRRYAPPGSTASPASATATTPPSSLTTCCARALAALPAHRGLRTRVLCCACHHVNQHMI